MSSVMLQNLDGSDEDADDQIKLNDQQQQEHEETYTDFISSRKTRRARNFSIKETFDLIKVWRKVKCSQAKSDSYKVVRIWGEISFEMSKLGYIRSPVQYYTRIKNLTSKFYKMKLSKKEYCRFKYPYYEFLNIILSKDKSETLDKSNSQGNIPAVVTAGKDLDINSKMNSLSSNLKKEYMNEFVPIERKQSPPEQISDSLKIGVEKDAKRKQNLLNPSNSSNNTNNSQTQHNALDHYLIESIKIQKQLLEIERGRVADGERMATYIMEIMERIIP